MKPLWWFFGSLNLPSDKRKPIKFEICSLFGSWNKLTNFWWTALESSLQVLPKHSTTLQCHKMKLLWRFFGPGNLPFREKEAIKFEIWTLFACSKEIYQFWGWGGGGGADLESCCQVWPRHSPTLQCHKIKLVWEALLQANYLSDKQPNKIWNLDPIRLLERNWPIFLGLSWKTGLIFGPDFA